MTRRMLVAGNWKSNGDRALVKAMLTGVEQQLSGQDTVEAAIYVPFLYVAEALTQADSTIVGAQNIAAQAAGAYTGEVSAAMLNDIACSSVLVGHSERRTLYGETDAIVAEKLSMCQQAGIQAVLCVGETLEQREAGDGLKVVAEQVAAALPSISDWSTLVIAYEPVWAIGTGKTATAEQAQEVHAAIRQQLNEVVSAQVAEQTRILYGGSVKPENAQDLFAQADIDGGLIGGASLAVSDFVACIQAAQNVTAA